MARRRGEQLAPDDCAIGATWKGNRYELMQVSRFKCHEIWSIGKMRNVAEDEMTLRDGEALEFNALGATSRASCDT